MFLWKGASSLYVCCSNHKALRTYFFLRTKHISELSPLVPLLKFFLVSHCNVIRMLDRGSWKYWCFLVICTVVFLQ